jgi:6-phosphogluconolactonase
MAEPKIQVHPDTNAIVADVAERIFVAYQKCLDAGQMFSLFLSGGSTPKALYQVLAGEPWRRAVDWTAVELYFGDERCVPPDSELSNYRMALETLISKVPIPPGNVHRMRGEIDPEQAAKEYGQMLKEKFHDEGPDVLLLGMGDDGHTASLFPGTKALEETHHRCVANYVPHDYIPAGTNWRITLTYPFINRSREVYILVTGAGKAKRVDEVLMGEQDINRLPIQGVQPTAGQVTWFLDVGAAGMNEDD